MVNGVSRERVGRGELPGQMASFGPATVPRQAATVILLRGGAAAIEALLVQRSPHARFMASVWVFPGGAVEADERGSPDGHRLAALRELREEAGVRLGSRADLVELSRWITPAEVEVRFDTRFFLAELPPGEVVRVDGEECVAHRWMTPAAALAACAAGELQLVLPTIKHLERLAGYPNVAELLGAAQGFDLSPVQPRIVLVDGDPRVLLPGEPGY